MKGVGSSIDSSSQVPQSAMTVGTAEQWSGEYQAATVCKVDGTTRR